jgi:hypothetical protein
MCDVASGKGKGKKPSGKALAFAAKAMKKGKGMPDKYKAGKPLMKGK